MSLPIGDSKDIYFNGREHTRWEEEINPILKI